MSQDFKVTTFDSTYSQRLASGDTLLGGSSGSNAGYLGGDVVGGPGGVTVVGLSSQVSLASNINGSLGDVLTIISTSPRTATFAAPSNTGSFELKIEGGQDTIFAHGSMGATETFDPTDGNVQTGTLNANCTVTLNAPTGTGACTLELWLTEDSTGGWAVTWPGSVTEQGTHTTTLSTTQRVILETIDGGTSWIATWIGSATGTTSPLTTKGDLYTYSTTNTRLAIGSNGTGLIADSAELTGNRWTLQALSGELLMADGVTGPPVPIESDPAQNDWLYADL